MIFSEALASETFPPAALVQTSPSLRVRGAALKAIALGLAALCCSATPQAQAQEGGQVPYATIHKVVSRAGQVKHPKVRAIVTLQSKTGAAKQKPITMVIQAKSGPINVAVSEDGEIRNFPISAELLKENPMVQSNQPKGSSQLRVDLEAVLPDGLSYSYRELSQLLDDASAEMKKQAGMLSMMMPRPKALSFEFGGGGKQTVTIKRAEPQVLNADANGAVLLEIDKKLAAEDPQVVVSARPSKVLVR
ncbi:MAG: hypothetical protein AVDCRST_MAG42-3352 [uncultured Chthoniobacterales bacterium]|uniref:Uncharacterized protein n=1 Tax=uncultured Chthoniobacterales bacterium TaxID=1836801 RepID=A0A6J4J7T1_9BACT|nr:MAG: hypothetical protein AVDCRST_MAG42-3352 [uncultured Chthoniobacterales bacterium]